MNIEYHRNNIYNTKNYLKCTIYDVYHIKIQIKIVIKIVKKKLKAIKK